MRISLLGLWVALTWSCAGPPRGTPVTTPAATVPITTRSEAALTAFREGRAAHEQGVVAVAKQAYERALAADPDFAQAHLFLGGLTFGSSEATAHFAAVRKLAPALPEAERRWIDLFLAMHAPDVPTRAAAKQALLRVAPEDPQVWKWLGFWAASPEERRDAVLHAARLAPDDVVVQNSVVYLHLERGENTQALAVAKRVVTLAPTPGAYDTRGEALLRAGHFAEAEQDFAHVLAHDPKVATQARQGIAAARYHRGDLAGAVAILREGLPTVPADERGAAVRDLVWFAALANDEATARQAVDDLATSQPAAARRLAAELDLYLHRWQALVDELGLIQTDASAYAKGRWYAIEAVARLALGDRPGAERAAAAIDAQQRPELAQFAKALLSGDVAGLVAAAQAVPDPDPVLDRLVREHLTDSPQTEPLRARWAGTRRDPRELAFGLR